MESKYKVGDIVKILGSENWKFIEKVESTHINGYEDFAYILRSGEKVITAQIVDIMNALPD